MRSKADFPIDYSLFKFLVFLFLIGYVQLLSPLLCAEKHKALAVTLKVNGKVNLIKAGTDSSILLKFGAVLDDGDKVKTGSDGFATIIFTDDKSQLKIMANTEVIIKGKMIVQENIAKIVLVDIGRVFVKTQKLKGSLSVVTPTSVASVKGTEFWVIVFEDKTTHVLPLDGLVKLHKRIDTRDFPAYYGVWLSEVDVRPGERGQADHRGEVGVEPVPRDQIPPDPDPGMETPKEIEIKEKGRTRRIILYYED